MIQLSWEIALPGSGWYRGLDLTVTRRTANGPQIALHTARFLGPNGTQVFVEDFREGLAIISASKNGRAVPLKMRAGIAAWALPPSGTVVEEVEMKTAYCWQVKRGGS